MGATLAGALPAAAAVAQFPRSGTSIIRVSHPCSQVAASQRTLDPAVYLCQTLISVGCADTPPTAGRAGDLALFPHSNPEALDPDLETCPRSHMQARSPRPVRRSAARAMELMSRAASVAHDALSDVLEGGDGSGDCSSRGRRSSEPTSPAAPASVAAFRLGGGRGGAAPTGAQRLFAAGERRIVLEGRPGSGAGQLIITAARCKPQPAVVAAGDDDAGTQQRRLPGSPAAMLAHWTIGSPSGDAAGL